MDPYRNDEEAAQYKVILLEKEIVLLRKKHEELQPLKTPNYQDICLGVASIVFVMVISLFGWATTQWVLAEDTIDFCYTTVNRYGDLEFTGHRNWMADKTMAVLKEIDDVPKAVEIFHCPLQQIANPESDRPDLSLTWPLRQSSLPLHFQPELGLSIHSNMPTWLTEENGYSDTLSGYPEGFSEGSLFQSSSEQEYHMDSQNWVQTAATPDAQMENLR